MGVHDMFLFSGPRRGLRDSGTDFISSKGTVGPDGRIRSPASVPTVETGVLSWVTGPTNKVYENYNWRIAGSWSYSRRRVLDTDQFGTRSPRTISSHL